MEISFKHHADLTIYWTQVHSTLHLVFAWVCQYLAEKKGVSKLRITAVYYEGGSGVHQALRALDFRIYKPAGEVYGLEYDGIQNLINAIWDYGDGKHNVAFVHDAGTGIHVHLQVRDETRRK